MRSGRRSSWGAEGGGVRRRAFLVTGASVLAATPLCAQGLPRIAYLGVQAEAIQDPRQIEQFKAGLAERGLIDGRTVAVEYHWADGKPERLQALAQALGGRSDIAVIVTVGSQAVRALLATG